MIVKIHTIHESREQHTQDIPSTDNFEQTIRQNIDGSLKANIYASGPRISKFMLLMGKNGIEINLTHID